MRAAEEQHLEDRRAADTHQRDHAAEVAILRARLLDAEAALASERSRLKELESLLGAAMQARDKAERALKAQHGRLRAIGPDGKAAEPTPGLLEDETESLHRGVNAYHSTQNIIRAFKVTYSFQKEGLDCDNLSFANVFLSLPFVLRVFAFRLDATSHSSSCESLSPEFCRIANEFL